MLPAARIESSTAQAQPPPKARADQVRALVPAMAGLIMLAIALLVLAWLGARIVRRRIRKPLKPTHPVADEWYSKPLNRPLPPGDRPRPDDKPPAV